MTISSPDFNPFLISISVTPVIPVSTGVNTAFLPRTRNTPCTSSFFGSPGAGGGGAARVTPLSEFFFACLAASSRSLRVRTASAWMGTAITALRSAVLIFAVVERPGRRLSGGLSMVMTTLKSFASCVLVVDCVVANPELRRIACEPISVTLPLKTFPGTASMVTSASWPILTFTMSVSSTFTSDVTTDMSERVIKKLPLEF